MRTGEGGGPAHTFLMANAIAGYDNPEEVATPATGRAAARGPSNTPSPTVLWCPKADPLAVPPAIQICRASPLVREKLAG